MDEIVRLIEGDRGAKEVRWYSEGVHGFPLSDGEGLVVVSLGAGVVLVLVLVSVMIPLGVVSLSGVLSGDRNGLDRVREAFSTRRRLVEGVAVAIVPWL